MWMFLNPPRIWIFESANTTRVLLAFSIANFVFPSFPAIRPIARPRCSPWRVFTSLTVISESDTILHYHKFCTKCISGPQHDGRGLLDIYRRAWYVLSNVSIYRSSKRSNAIESSTSKPRQNAWIKSAPFCKAPVSVVYLDVLNSTAFDLIFIRTCNFRCSTRGG